MTIAQALSVAPEAALKLCRKKGLKTSFAWQDVFQQEHEAAFTVAKMMDVDLLSDVRDLVDKAISEGWTFQRFHDELKPQLVKRGWWGKAEQVDPDTGEVKVVELGSVRRLRTIFRVNMQTAYAAGDWAQIQENADTAPYLMYDAVDDNRTRPQHKAWDGTVLPVDDAWWDTHRPPNGWNCRCGTIQLSEREAKRRGLKTDGAAPASPTREYVNPRTGEISRVPVGIDPGFAYNPGKARVDELRKQLDAKQRAWNDGR